MISKKSWFEKYSNLIIIILGILIIVSSLFLYFLNKDKNNSDFSEKIEILGQRINDLEKKYENCSTEQVVIKNDNSEVIDGNIQKININLADKSQLEEIPGIGSTKADEIINYRNQYGYFLVIEDIQNVKGIGPSTFEKMADYITIDE